MDFHQWDGARSIHALIHPCHRQSCNGCYRFKGFLLTIGHQVTHLTTVRHAREESVFAAQMVSLLDMARHAAQGFHIVHLPTLLERVAHIPAALALGVSEPLGDAHRKAVPVGRRDHRVLAPDASTVAMQHEHHWRTLPHAIRQVHHQMAHVSIHLDQVLDKAPRHAP